MGARNRVGIGFSYRPTRLHRLAELIPWNRFLGSFKVKKFGLRVHGYIKKKVSPLSVFNEELCVGLHPEAFLQHILVHQPHLHPHTSRHSSSEPVFVIVYEAQESIPRNRFSQPMWLGGPVRKIGLWYWPARLGVGIRVLWCLKRKS
jgi:hypothetical protein